MCRIWFILIGSMSKASFWWQAPSLEARLRNIVEALTFDVYNYTCLSLFECHKLMFSFQVRPMFVPHHVIICTVRMT